MNKSKPVEKQMDFVFRLYEFNVCNGPSTSTNEHEQQESSQFKIQVFGLNEKGEHASIMVERFEPFFYIQVPKKWKAQQKQELLDHLKKQIGKYYADNITSCIFIERKKLYNFDAGKLHRFILVKFSNIQSFNKMKNLWYEKKVNSLGESEFKLKSNGYLFQKEKLIIYESNIPPLLRFFHLREISPSGWVSLPIKKLFQVPEEDKKTSCTYEFSIYYKDIIPLNHIEKRVPYKIMSFDIEASSSHGDFPVPIKSYKKLATNIVDYLEKIDLSIMDKHKLSPILERMVKAAFGCERILNDPIDLVYTKKQLTEEQISSSTISWLKTKVREQIKKEEDEEYQIQKLFENANKIQQVNATSQLHAEEDDLDELDADEDSEVEVEGEQSNIANIFLKKDPVYKNKQSTIVDILLDKQFVREGKINELVISLRNHFPALEGDKVTFIGSTFFRYGEKEPYLNHCITLNTCDTIENQVANSIIETYDTEAEVLLAWKDLVQRENPDIVIGYNIFSFDYEFMFRRAQELYCVEDFLQLSRNKKELCGIDKSSITLASGTYDLSIIKMNGRLQIDMLNWFRRTENLTSYKLDYVGSHFIGDDVKQIEHLNSDDSFEENLKTRIKTNNMTGLHVGSFIHFEEINHSSDYYKDGAKFQIVSLNKEERYFEIKGHEYPQAKKVKWGLAKDDVSPKDIFRLTNEGPASRAIIAKYCIQDCNLVHYLFNKVDVITDLVEMAKLCSVPMSFLIFRGQGIKLTSYVAKKCREKGVLMPVIEKSYSNEGYEGAIVLEPKCGLYLDQPVAVGDFASLYPSSMLSENLCPSSKVWTKTYDLENRLIEDTGEKDENGNFLYDNLPDYTYVNIQFDTFKYVRKNPKARAEKICSGYKICRFAQGKAIMPSILEELLKARKDTRKMIYNETDDFMKNVLDKRQLAYKVTANSLYGQLGAKTSTFYEPDIAASTTATGRLLLTYAKRVVEECYHEVDVQTSQGVINTTAEYIYGDTDSVFFIFHLIDVSNGEKIVGQQALELSIEIAQQACGLVSKFLKQPHDFEYEKTFLPFCLLSKKRYVGILYEHDPTKGKRKEMGIVLKRRDNAPIVKDIYGGVIDILMKERDIQKSIDYVNTNLQVLVEGNIPMDKLVITKSIRSFYKNPKQIAHKVLADRIAAREPGNKPTSGDRIPFVYIVNKDKKALQGERIETPTYIVEKDLSIDYSFYITNQIMKPLLQLFGLVIEDIWRMKQKLPKISKFKKEINKIKSMYNEYDEKKIGEKIDKLKEKEVKALIFDKYITVTTNAKNGDQSIVTMFEKQCKIK